MHPIDAQRKDLWRMFRDELTELHHNSIKESLLLLHPKETEYILHVSTELKCTPLAKHSAVSLYSQFMREYHTQKRSSFLLPSLNQKMLWILTCIILASKMNDRYHNLQLCDVVEYLPNVPIDEFVKCEFEILQILDYSINLRGGVPLKALHYALLHYGETMSLKEGETMYLCTIGENVLEHVLVQREILASKSREVIVGISVASIALYNKNGFIITSKDLEWVTALFGGVPVLHSTKRVLALFTTKSLTVLEI